MTRRNFLKTTGAGAVALAAAKTSVFAADEDKPLRVALIGCGWYGKTDLFHLIQVAPVEVVGLCDVDSQAAGAASELVATQATQSLSEPIASIAAFDVYEYDSGERICHVSSSRDPQTGWVKWQRNSWSAKDTKWYYMPEMNGGSKMLCKLYPAQQQLSAEIYPLLMKQHP